jgi:hypothetical protein
MPAFGGVLFVLAMVLVQPATSVVFLIATVSGFAALLRPAVQRVFDQR